VHKIPEHPLVSYWRVAGETSADADFAGGSDKSNQNPSGLYIPK
jgi:hypothetical protein